MKLANPTPFFKKMVERDPVLFLTEDSEKFNSYSRTCLSSNRVQPVILNEEEKEKIDREMPGFLKEDDVVKYGSTPGKQNYYICPRYWCLKTNMPISPEDVAAGKCGAVIPRNEKKVPKGAYVYEFFNASQHGSQDKYTQHYPGFVNDTKSQKHPDNLCIPCCYKDANSEIQKIMRKKCIKPGAEAEAQETQETQETQEAAAQAKRRQSSIQKPGPESESESESEPKELVAPMPLERIAEKEEQYIQGPEKFPLDPGRWGYLPFQIQKFLQEVNADCQISKTNTNIKPGHPCILRHGVIYDDNQSFLACITDALLYDKSATIATLKDMIIQGLNIDNFIIYQNGNLVQSFMIPEYKDINIDKYKSSKLYKKCKKDREDAELDLDYFKQIANSFENFIAFLKDDKVVIDYTYLWDILCLPNPYLFKSGINLVILEITDNDSTNNISIICPTNHYSSEFYVARKKTLIIMKKAGKKGTYYEPIYSYKDLGKDQDIVVQRLFSEYDPQLSTNMRSILKKLIKPILQNKCFPLSSIPNQAEYKFKRPIELSTLIVSLNKFNYEIIQQVVNYNTKVIGILAKNTKGKTGFIPCYPSSIDPTYDYIFMNEVGIFNDYNTTIDFLMTLYVNSSGKLPCKPDFKVVETDYNNAENNVMVVGILTETNQYVEINPPEPLININDSVKIFNSNNYLIADKESLVTSPVTKIDQDRVEYITKLKLETNFLNVFRNSIRILLNEYENLSIRENIEELANSVGDLYKYKLKQITLLLEELVKDKITFSEDYNYNMIHEITTCIVQNPNKCESNKPLCALINNGKTCQLVLPKKNLLNGTDNKKTYFVKMADEIIRYNRIKSFLFKPQSFASFNPLNYNLREDEIIVIQSMLNQEYFDGLIPIETNQFIKYNSYDNVQPIKTQKYGDQEGTKECLIEIKNNETITKNPEWKKAFPKDFGEYEFLIKDPSDPLRDKDCTFIVFADIMKRIKGLDLTIEDIKIKLFNQYLMIDKQYTEIILDILSEEGKKTLADKGKIEFKKEGEPDIKKILQNLIFDDSYFLTQFDLWLLLSSEKIPSFFIVKQGTSIRYNGVTENPINSFLCYGEPEDNFLFITVPGFSPTDNKEKAPSFKIIKDNKNDNIRISLDELNEGKCLTDLNKSIESKITIKDYLSQFQKKLVPQNTKAAKKQKAKLVLKGEAEPEAEAEAKIGLDLDLPTLIKETERKVPGQVQVSRIIVKKKKATKGKPKEKKQETKRAKGKPNPKITIVEIEK